MRSLQHLLLIDEKIKREIQNEIFTVDSHLKYVACHLKISRYIAIRTHSSDTAMCSRVPMTEAATYHKLLSITINIYAYVNNSQEKLLWIIIHIIHIHNNALNHNTVANISWTGKVIKYKYTNIGNC